MSISDKGEKLSKKGFFFTRKATRPVVEEKAVDSTEELELAKPEVPPISFTQLFRCVVGLNPSSCCSDCLHSYSTKFELFLDAVGLLAAVGGGGAQVDSRTTRFTCLTS